MPAGPARSSYPRPPPSRIAAPSSGGREPAEIGSDVFGPVGHEVLEALPIALVERPEDLLVARLVAADGLQEAVGGVLLRPALRPLRALRLVDEAAEGGRCPPRLRGKPIPVSRQQGHLLRL